MTNEIIEAEVVSDTTELTVAPANPPTLFRTDDPVEVLSRAAEVANALAPAIEERRLFANISGKKHITVEGWTTLGAMMGVTPVCVWTRNLDNGWEARVEARTLDGRVIGAAEAQCTRDEKMWKSRDDYALRSMAQTRATSKALGSVLRFIVTLAGYAGTPAEEMPHDGPHGGSAQGEEFADDVLPEGRFTGSVHVAKWIERKKDGRSVLLLEVVVKPATAGKQPAREKVWIDPLREEFTAVCDELNGGDLIDVQSDVSGWEGRPIDIEITMNGKWRNHKILPATEA